MFNDKQIIEWVKGNSIHDGNCCPDFSCCKGKSLLAPESERKRFAKYYFKDDYEAQNDMLVGFLSKLLEREAIKNPHITGV